MLNKYFRFFFKFKRTLIEYLQESFWVILGQFGVVIAGFLIIKKLSIILTIEDYGLLGLSLSLAALNNTLIFGPIINSFSRFFSISGAKSQIYLFKKVSTSIWTSAVKYCSIFYVILSLIFFFLEIYDYLFACIFVFVFVLLQSYKSKNISIFHAARNRKTVSLIQNVEVWVKVFLIFTLYKLDFQGLLIYSSTFLLSLTFSNIISFILIRKNIFHQIDSYHIKDFKRLKKELLSFSRPYFIWGGFVSLQQSSDRISISKFNGLIDNGIYSALYQIGFTPISTIFGLFNTIYLPIIFQKFNSFSFTQKQLVSLKKILNSGVLFSLLFICLSFLTVYYYKNVIVLILLDPKYEPYSDILPWITLTAGFISLGEFIGSYFSTRNIQNDLIKLKISLSILCVLMNFFSGYNYGLKGVVFSVLVFSILYFISIYFKFLSDVKKQIS